MIANMYFQALLDKLEWAPDHLKLDNSLSFFENFAREHNRNETAWVGGAEGEGESQADSMLNAEPNAGLP